MTVPQILPTVVAVIEFSAGLVYAYHRNYWLALTWVCYALACVGLAKASP